jgi:hypothetical protein
LNSPYPIAAITATGAAAVIIAPAAIPPPTAEPTAAIPDDIAAPPARPEAPAADAKAAPVVPAVADMIVAADPPITAEAVLAATKAVATEPAAPTAVDFFIFVAFRCKKTFHFNSGIVNIRMPTVSSNVHSGLTDWSSPDGDSLCIKNNSVNLRSGATTCYTAQPG